MPKYAAPIKEIEFILFDVMDIAASPILGYSDLDPALVAALVHEVGKISTDILLPLNAASDTEGTGLKTGSCVCLMALMTRSKHYGRAAGAGLICLRSTAVRACHI